jgi:hypothetical protein
MTVLPYSNSAHERALIADFPVPSQRSFATGALLEQLARALEAQGLAYCQWKGHWSAHRWMSGQGDVDLLVDRAARAEFRRLMGELGFKPALPSGERQIPALESYLGYDPAIPRPLHLHVHYRLMLGDFGKPVYRLPIEDAVLASARQSELFRIPAPSYQFLIFVLRMMLRQLGRPLLSLQTGWLTGIQPPLFSFESAADETQVESVLQRHVPSIDLPLFRRCVRSLQGRAGVLERAVLPWILARRLRPYLRRPPISALATAIVEKLLPPGDADLTLQQRLRLTGVGTVIALLGGDGAGKSTCARELAVWMGAALPVMRAHLGNPPRSPISWVLSGVLKLDRALRTRFGWPESPDGTLELLRHVSAARDRYLFFCRVSRFAAAGGIAICESYPIEETRTLIGPSIPALLKVDSGRLARALRNLEGSYYRRITRPDLICVLRLDPELAVLRKPESPADQVRARARFIWNTDWISGRAQVIDAGKPLPDVLRQLKSVIWPAL